MSLIIGVLKEIEDKRVAITPDNIKRSKLKDAQWWIEKGAGEESGFTDPTYAAPTQIKSRQEILQQADIILSVFPPSESEFGTIRKDALLISQFRPYQDES